MDVLQIKKSSSQRVMIESWDDDNDLEGFEDLQLRQSTATSAFAHTLKRSPRHRESTSSRLSNRSGEDDSEWQLLVGEDDPANAIKHAHNAGVPIPANIPASALLGGAIRKLGTKKKASKDNYDDDIEFPTEGPQGLRLKIGQDTDYPAVLRSVSGNTIQTRTPPETPTRISVNKNFQEHLNALSQGPSNASLDKFRDEEEDVFDDIPTIKVGKVRTPLRTAGFYAMPQGVAKLKSEEDVMDGLEFPDSGSPLKLSARKETPTTPLHLLPADLEIDSMETSNSTFSASIRSSRPSGRSERSSSVTAHSPSVFSPALSSAFTAESEEDGLEGLVLPDGPVNFGEALKRRLESVSPDPSPAKRPEMQAPPKDDFFDDLDIDDGRVFDASKLRINRNVRLTNSKGASPSRKGATTITFTNRPSSATTRIPKPSPMERPRSKMETIAENGPAPQARRTQSRLLNHSTQPSLSSLPTPATPTSLTPSVPSTPTRRGLGTRSSAQNMRPEATTTSAQLLKAKRSLPMMRNQPSPARPQSMYARPPSRTDRTQKPVAARPKTPIEGLGGLKAYAPFIPPGNTKGASHHITSRHTRIGPRPTSSDSSDNVGLTGRPLSRLSNSQYRPKTPTARPDIAPESLTRQAIVKRTMTKPTKRRVFGDGTELDGFDDLVTSKEQESKYVRQPREVQSTHTLRSSHRNSGDLRKHFSAQNLAAAAIPHQVESKASPHFPFSPPRSQSTVPGFARDTAASRLAREQRVSRLNPQPNRQVHASDGNLNSRFKDQLMVKAAIPPRQLRRTKKASQPLKLIQNLGSNSDAKAEKGMHYNAKECKWEGNEAALASFDAVPVDRKKASTPNAGSSTSPTRKANNTTPKPALIAPFGQKKDVAHQVGGMVFDPARMCWLKIDTKHMTPRSRHDTLHSATMSASSTGHGARSVTTATEDDDEDPFAGIADLEDERRVETGAGAKKTDDRKRSVSGTHAGELSSDEDWGIGEDFDVGPEFVRRQRREEQRYARKLAPWGDRLNAKPKSNDEVFAEREEMMKILSGFWE